MFWKIACQKRQKSELKQLPDTCIFCQKFCNRAFFAISQIHMFKARCCLKDCGIISPSGEYKFCSDEWWHCFFCLIRFSYRYHTFGDHWWHMWISWCTACCKSIKIQAQALPDLFLHCICTYKYFICSDFMYQYWNNMKARLCVSSMCVTAGSILCSSDGAPLADMRCVLAATVHVFFSSWK